MSIAPIHRTTRGEKPMIPPHLLARILAKLKEREARREKRPANDDWANIDALAETMEAAK